MRYVNISFIFSLVRLFNTYKYSIYIIYGLALCSLQTL